MTDDFFHELVVRAATLDEWFSESFQPLPAEKADVDAGTRRLAAWCAASAGGDWSLFARRLNRDGLSHAEVFQRLAGVTRTPGAKTPQWLETAEWIDYALRRAPSPSFRTRLHVIDGVIPFEDLLCGLVEEAERRLWLAISASPADLLSEEATIGLPRELAQELVSLCAPILYEQFRRVAPLEPRSAEATSTASNGTYAAFISFMRREGLRSLFTERPVLLRLIATITSQWIEGTTEFLGRLSTDQDDLAALISTPTPLIVARTSTVGDLHNHGRAVRIVAFTNGQKAFYKPKDLRIDHVWSELIENLNRKNPPFALRTPRSIVKDGYGWAESIEHTACNSTDDFSTYFRKAGGWLCLFHLFSGMDMHEQNILASGSEPVPVDLETLLQPTQVPDVPESDSRRAYTLAGAAIAHSVLSTGLLPGYGRLGGDSVIAHGGFMETKTRKREIQWNDVNSDRMRPVARWTTGRPNENRPHIDGRYADIKDFIDPVVSGYVEYATFVLKLVGSTGIEDFVGPFQYLKVRKLIKNTRFYSLLIDRLRDHRNMTDGAAWSSHLDFVCRFIDWDADDDPWWPLVRSERMALAELNIPLFVMAASSATICDIDGRCANSALRPGVERVRATLDELNETEIERQAEIIRLSLSSVRKVEASLQLRKERIARASTSEHAVNDIATLRSRANAIADHIERIAFRAPNSAAWLGLDWLQDSSVCQLSPLGADLYNGAVGVSIFLAAQAKVSEDRRSAELALAGLSALRGDLLGANAARSARALGIGGSTGLGSIIYGLTTIAELTQDSALLGDALAITRLFTDELIAADVVNDVMDGASGAILSLLKLHRATKAPEALERAIACGQHLLASAATPGPSQFQGRANGLMKSGMSHGAAGVAYALTALASQLSGATAKELMTAASGWLDLEDATFCEIHGNWPDARSPSPYEDAFWPSQWCHGAAGIGLARIATAGLLRSTEAPAELIKSLDRDVRRAVKAVLGAWPYATDSLCCGSLGGIELLSEAGRYLKEPELERRARERMFDIVAEANREGDYLWDIADRRVNIGLFRGLTGVGYVLLRQADPTLPNLLVWA